MSTFASLEALRAAAGSELGSSRWIDVTQERIDGFARYTEDDQWIHTDPDRARSGPFGTTIAHGYLTVSLIAPLLTELLLVDGISMAVNYGFNKVRFPAALPSGTPVRATGRLDSVEDIQGGVQTSTTITIETPDGTRPVCVAEVLSRLLA
ncbi:MaoC family dehydratase [Nocardioides sp. WS12]|uniref:MaoC family dehydratase n=1 Tax=Nocardioides sp. WS12 TaxID=2486272 RepID=UPI0015FCA9F6|nr:MaoC family dehydratase [Nocardioides sp. WS12]